MTDSLPRFDVLCARTMAMQALLYLFRTESFDWFWRWGHWRRPRWRLARFRPRESGGGMACRLARWTRRRRRVKEYSSDDLLAKFGHLDGLSRIIGHTLISLGLCCRRRSLRLLFFFYLFLHSSPAQHNQITHMLDFILKFSDSQSTYVIWVYIHALF